MTGAFLAALRVHLASHPLLALIAGLALVQIAGRVRPLRMSPIAATRATISIAAAVSLSGLAGYFAAIVFYASDPHYFDAAEPTMTAVGWLFHVGQPIYHDVGSAERYAHIYGPLAFIVHGLALGIFGPSILVSKWTGAVLAIAAVAFTWVALLSSTTLRRATVITGTCTLLLLEFRNYSFWTRAEPLQLCAVAAALVAAAWARGPMAPIVVGVCAGVLCNVKITGPLYALPLLVLLGSRRGSRPVIAAVMIAILTAILPFVAWTNISASGYFTWVRLSAGTGLLLSTLRQNIEWAAYFSVPLVLAWHATSSMDRPARGGWSWIALALGLSTCGVVIAGSKPGAGPYHLLPLLPVVFYLVAARLGSRPLVWEERSGVASGTIAFVAVALCTALVQQMQFVSTMNARRSLDEVGDIEQFAATHTGVVEMGYGADDPWTFERPVLVFRNNAYLIDQPAVGEHQLAGLPIPPATIAAVRACRVEYWLIPKGEAPFTVVNMYAPVYGRPLYSDEFRRAFLETYATVETTRYFDAWRCRTSVQAPGMAR